ncbi:methionine aminopeptidase, type I [Propionimicrobium lymphophilum ACS-093-V-SCH5]|uniref:Methionine aminopeptidase n=1 Tax=Propionimicrobium lymphophilum ACS-093-V-SCH5 TaxID=883161 RepID=S2WK19_9ACTN|nr:type I methionyl aminopeptidase [Propionimicrobium lymphophilum]EPD33027.1 methionine aminopeptidase, type I [Propionimicrobium lymphophilum ACS-093-V-SCH5]
MFGRGIEIKSDDQIKLMRKAGLVVSEALNLMVAETKPGMTTSDVDQMAREVLAKHGADSSFLNYGADWGIMPFPGVICCSVNETVVHGIPGDRVIKDGDLVSVDFGAIVDGWHGDAARSFIVGQGADHEQRAEREELINVTRESMWRGIAQVKPGNRVGDIGHAVEDYINSCGSYGILRDYTGHGIGTAMHQNPDVPNYGRKGRGAKLTTGMCICIEPMVTLGTEEVAELDDDWTVVTQDSSDSAHWENTIAMTSKGLWILTEPDGGEERLKALGLPFGGLGD